MARIITSVYCSEILEPDDTEPGAYRLSKILSDWRVITLFSACTWVSESTSLNVIGL